MVHIIYGSYVYLNIDTLRRVGVDTSQYKIKLDYGDSYDYLDVCNHPKVKEILANTREEEAPVVKTQVCYKVLGVILERLANTDENASPIINLEAGLATLQKAESVEERAAREAKEDIEEFKANTHAEVIPVTVDKDGNITKVIKEEE